MHLHEEEKNCSILLKHAYEFPFKFQFNSDVFSDIEAEEKKSKSFKYFSLLRHSQRCTNRSVQVSALLNHILSGDIYSNICWSSKTGELRLHIFGYWMLGVGCWIKRQNFKPDFFCFLFMNLGNDFVKLVKCFSQNLRNFFFFFG